MINHIKIFSYNLALIADQKTRSGFIIGAFMEDSQAFFAEISPLPSWSKESSDQALEQLIKTIQILKDFPSKMALDWTLDQTDLLPSVSFGLFSLFYQIVHPPLTQKFPISGLLYGNFEQISKDIPYLIERGFKKVKLKTKDLSSDEAKKLIEELSNNFSLRVDINRAWTKEQTDNFFSSFNQNIFDYIEEPYPNAKDLCSFSLPIAIDETLRELSLKEIQTITNIKAIIIKPMMMGVGPCVKKIIESAKKNNFVISLSSSIESGIGLYQIGLFADFFKLHDAILGIDTYKMLANDLILSKHRMENGMAEFSSIKPDLSLMKEIYHV